ncbi:hypothetical protein T484DRAFT_1809870 [Baffinella frigidus]|nr:hypothetical protein T484DRAFT_1809870 [Cryptophyta sp. CCMP2293]
MLAVGTEAGRVKMYKASTGEVRADVAAHTKSVTAVALSPDGATLVTAGDLTSQASCGLWGGDDCSVCGIDGMTGDLTSRELLPFHGSTEAWMSKGG